MIDHMVYGISKDVGEVIFKHVLKHMNYMEICQGTM